MQLLRRALARPSALALVLGTFLGLFITLPAAYGHLIVDQKGTINFVEDGAFLVVSLPVAALEGADDDGDGKLSFAEMARHTPELQRQIKAGIRLTDRSGEKALDGLLLNLSPPDSAPSSPATHIVAMGRFALGGPAESFANARFESSLFGRAESERTLIITLKRGGQSQLLLLTPDNPGGRVFPPAWVIFLDVIRSGATHVLSGLDHLLFLLVVLAAGWTPRQLVTVLTGFTLGHALTLSASILGGLSLSPNLVEPAIAATIVTMGLLDLWDKRRVRRTPLGVRIGLVFACSLIHGLGLAGALTTLGLTPENRVLSLVGFNLGIELGQLAFAAGAWLIASIISRAAGPDTLKLTERTVSTVAILAGIFWFAQRTWDAISA
jgi:hydrogenase/urease accessory protein HupE